MDIKITDMTKLIQRHEAAEMIGVTRQTIQNWIDKGILKSSKIGKATYVSVDVIKALAPDVKSIAESRQKLEEERKEVKRLLDEYKERHRQLRTDLRILPTCAESAVRKEFYLSLIDMLKDNLYEREHRILRDILDGYTMEEIGQRLGLTRERVRQIAYKAIRKLAHLINLRALEIENKELKTEITAIKSQITPLQEHITELEERLGIKEAGIDDKTEELYRLLVKPISDYNVSVRCMNAMIANDVSTIGDLAKMDLYDVKRFRNVGKKTIQEMQDLLEKVGLYFGYDVDRVIKLYTYTKS